MGRYLKLYLYFLQFSFSRAMEFRLDFYFRIFMDLNYYFINIVFYKILYLHTPYLAGWNEHQIMIFVASYFFIDAMVMTLFSNNLWWLPVFVNKGDLDYYLVRPVSSLFFLSLRDFAANSFVNLLMTFGIWMWAVATYPEALNWANILVYLVLLLCGVFLYYCMRMLFIIPVFWTHSARGFDQAFWIVAHTMERPDRIFKGFIRKLFTTLLPFSLMASFPARVLMESLDPKTIFHVLAVTGLFGGILVLLWNKALKSYSSASS